MQMQTKSKVVTKILQRMVQNVFTLYPLQQLKLKLLSEQQQSQQIKNQHQEQFKIAKIKGLQDEELKIPQHKEVEVGQRKPNELASGINKQEDLKQNQLKDKKLVTQQSQSRKQWQSGKNEQILQKQQQIKQSSDHKQIINSQSYPLQNISSSKQIHQLKQPPYLNSKKNYTEQSSQKQHIKDSKDKFRKISSQQESINLDLTQKTKKENHMASTYGKADSLIYSDATLIYSNATGFGHQLSQQSHKKSSRKQSSHKQLNKIEDSQQNAEISARMQRAESRQINRIRTDSQNKTDLQINLKTQQDQKEQNIFQTEIYDKKRISRIKELKENKKKKLQKQLKRVNQELQQLTKKQLQAKSNPKSNNYESRVKISDNVEAKVKAEKLIKNLRYEKKSRHDAHLDELQILDKNINQYMQEIVKERYKNQDRIKQKKKLEIIQRMKKQQIRKIEQQKLKEKNLEFLHQIKNSGSKNNLIPIKTPQQKQSYEKQTHIKQKYQQNQHNYTKQRSHTKKSESIIDESQITPQLSRKKALMKRLRNLSLKKQKKIDVYEQVLG